VQDARKSVRDFTNASKVLSSTKVENFAVYGNRQRISRFLAQAFLFNLQKDVKGSIVECGVFHGGGLFAYAQLSEIYEPSNYHRQIIGFDTFEGFPDWDPIDQVGVDAWGGLQPDHDSFTELTAAAAAFQKNAYIDTKEKIRLVKGDATKTIPTFIEENPHFVCSMLYLDFDLYEPTKIAIESFLPRMPKGSILAFDEVHNPFWPGETKALLDTIGIRNLQLKGFTSEPNISYAIL